MIEIKILYLTNRELLSMTIVQFFSKYNTIAFRKLSIKIHFTLGARYTRAFPLATITRKSWLGRDLHFGD